MDGGRVDTSGVELRQYLCKRAAADIPRFYRDIPPVRISESAEINLFAEHFSPARIELPVSVRAADEISAFHYGVFGKPQHKVEKLLLAAACRCAERVLKELVQRYAASYSSGPHNVDSLVMRRPDHPSLRVAVAFKALTIDHRKESIHYDILGFLAAFDDIQGDTVHHVRVSVKQVAHRALGQTDHNNPTFPADKLPADLPL